MNKIEHFLLPEEANHLYEEEARSSISLTKEVADKINELIDAYNALSNTDLKWKQEQEGKIRGGILYMKDNLLNTLNDLLKLFKSETFIDDRVQFYVKELTQRLDNLVGNVSEYSELTDIRVGANGYYYSNAGKAIREQISEIIKLFSGKNILTDYKYFNGFYSVNEAGDTEIPTLFTGGELRDYHEICSDFVPVKYGKAYTASAYCESNPLTEEKMWLCIHCYDENKNFIKREFADESTVYNYNRWFTPDENTKYVKVMCRTYHNVYLKFEEGLFATNKDLFVGNLMKKYPLTMDGCYTYSVDADYIIFDRIATTNQEKSTIGINCYGKKKLIAYVDTGANSWLSFNFLNADRKFVVDNKPNRVVINNSGRHEIEIPDDACTMFISARTLTLNELAVFFETESIDDEQSFYETIYQNKKVVKDAISNISSIPPIEPYQVKSIAHRGYSFKAPENTHHAFKEAYNAGFKYVECDLGFTSDNIPVLLHDYSVDRTSNGTGDIKDLTYEYVSGLDFGSWFSSEYTGTRVMLFTEFINMCRCLQLHPYIEVKETSTDTQLDTLIDIVKSYGMINNVTWISFGYSQLSYIVSKVPTARVGFVVNDLTNEAIDRTLELKSGVNHVFADCYNYTTETINYAVANNVPVEVWVINDTEKLANTNPYISGITSDNIVADKELMKLF